MTWFRLPQRSAKPAPAPERPDPAEAAARFWDGWHELLPEVAAALGEGEPHRVENALCELVAALHPDLHFSLDRGQVAIYSLVVSGQEDPALRPVTDAWKAAAPPDGTLWEYHDSVPPVPDPTGVVVNLGPHRVALADVRVHVQVDEAAGVVDVAVHHPVLAELDEPARAALTFLPLDAALGERLAGRRLRRVETAATEPVDCVDLLELRRLVRAMTG
ncbi:hypothetical protein [Actinokineospora bangkokensis]|uniref:Uncharacterized protein n=1 Tax=Actinokineospora bangkokensis TaxID=1193682 RepID=A0A1Q9LHX6_9PSEU|nr:hypothetical protein [Actinokineospora bangkokensis]OLR91625.1 hypothetical protein BJP25_26070 [Actinokineospora bangkokensis]